MLLRNKKLSSDTGQWQCILVTNLSPPGRSWPLLISTGSMPSVCQLQLYSFSTLLIHGMGVWGRPSLARASETVKRGKEERAAAWAWPGSSTFSCRPILKFIYHGAVLEQSSFALPASQFVFTFFVAASFSPAAAAAARSLPVFKG